MRGSTVGLSAKEAWDEAMAEVEALPPDDDSTSEESSAPVAEVTEHPTSTESLFDALNPEAEQENTLQAEDSTLFTVPGGASVSLGELQKGYLRQDDYTKKTTEVAQLRKEAEDALALWQALQTDPTGTLRRLGLQLGSQPARQPLVSEKGYSAQPGQVDIEKLVNEKLEERLKNDPRLQTLEHQQSKQLVEIEFGKIEEDFGVRLSPRDRLTVLQKAQQLGTTDLQFVFSGLLKMVEKRTAQKKNLKGASTAQGRGSESDTPVIEDKVPEDFWDAVAQTMKELQIDDLSKAF